MTQVELFHEDIYEALRTCIGALGGAKKVGVLLRPEMAADKAGNWLNDCLNTAKRDKLDIEQVLYILKEARKVGCHAAMFFIADDCDYRRPEPIEPNNEIAELQKQSIEAVNRLEGLVKRMKHMQSLQNIKSVV
ncbi:MAG: hypothetical protein AB2792_22210 [Candidatus Thiodiazotropha sp.]